MSCFDEASIFRQLLIYISSLKTKTFNLVQFNEPDLVLPSKCWSVLDSQRYDFDVAERRPN